MSDEHKVVKLPLPAKEVKVKVKPRAQYRLPRWHCQQHGTHDQVVHVATIAGDERTYCVMCIVALLDHLGLKSLSPHDNGGRDGER